MGARENAVKNSCMDLLAMAGAFAWTNNTGQLGYVKFGYPGSPDIIGIMPGGRFIGVETKAPAEPPAFKDFVPRKAKGVQSDTQVEFEERVKKVGGTYILAHSSEVLEAWLREEGYL